MSDIVIKTSRHSVSVTVSHLLAVVAAKGMKLFAVIDHSGEASRVGLELRETKVVIFGSPNAGTPVMVTAPLAALDLPLRVLVWADDHATKLAYLEPSTYVERYGLSEELASRLAGIHAVVDAALAAGGSSATAAGPAEAVHDQPQEECK
jgi:uncharacterized protein (DUF302 family)